VSRTLSEFVDERCFADSGFTGHKNDLSLPLNRAVQATLQIPEHPISTNQLDAGRGRRLVTLDVAKLGNKLVATARDRFQEERCFRIVSKRFSEIENVSLYDLGLNVDLGPDALEQLFLGD
jgi:hypothetical protein